MLVKVKTLSFRAAALVKGRRDPSVTSLEFLELSAGGKDALEEVLKDLVRFNVLTQKLRADRIDPATERALAEEAQFRWLKTGNARLLVRTVRDDSEPVPSLVAVGPGEIQQGIVRVPTEVGMDLFG